MPKYHVNVTHRLIGGQAECTTSGDLVDATMGEALDEFIRTAVRQGHEVTYASVSIDDDDPDVFAEKKK